MDINTTIQTAKICSNAESCEGCINNPYVTQNGIIRCKNRLIEHLHKHLAATLNWIPTDCRTCNHENCSDCDHRFDGWQLKGEL